MGKIIDLTGQRFGRLIVIKRADNSKDNRAKWLCKCDCGNEKNIVGKSLRKMKTQSCGCLQKEKAKMVNTKHGKRYTKLNKTWNSMKQRCNNSNCKQYKNYGGRGIKVCEEWVDKENGFMNFYNWAMQNGFQENLTIDRIDVNGNYEPDNCRWTDMKQQCNNRRDNHNITYNNETHTIAEWSEILKIKRYTLYSRINMLKMPIKKAFEKSTNRCKKVNQYDIQGKLIKTWKSISEAEEILGISCSNICNCCKGKRENAGGYIWRYADEDKS